MELIGKTKMLVVEHGYMEEYDAVETQDGPAGVAVQYEHRADYYFTHRDVLLHDVDDAHERLEQRKAEATAFMNGLFAVLGHAAVERQPLPAHVVAQAA